MKERERRHNPDVKMRSMVSRRPAEITWRREL